jgi:G:T-mismatch repair DNA endonuclease (very short patch repair protein)
MSGLTVGLFLYGYTAVALPGWVDSVLLPLAWLVFFVLGCAWFLRHPYRVLVLPVLAIALWFLVVLIRAQG